MRLFPALITRTFNSQLCNIGYFSFGLPDPCQNVTCDYHSKCSALPNDTAVCLCEDDCASEPYKPVCGSDGVTYQSECALKAKACKERKVITVDAEGICRKFRDKCTVDFFNSTNTI